MYLSLLSALILLTAPVLRPQSIAESFGHRPAGPIYRMAIPETDPGKPGPGKVLAKGTFLVASRRLQDPNFRQTVVLLVDYGPEGAMGLVINRPSDVKLATVFPDIEALKESSGSLYVGGPVAVNQVLMLISTSRAPEDAKHIIEDIYISSSREVLERLVKSPAEDKLFRLYAGYAGWAPHQLDFEKTRGDWYVLKAETDAVFSQNPSELWPELINRITAKWVRAENPLRDLN